MFRTRRVGLLALAVAALAASGCAHKKRARLPFDDPGFDHTVLPEFRDRVADAGLEQAALDALLERLAAEDLVKDGGKQRTDSTHVVAAVAALSRLELAGESVRAVLEALAAAHPDWLGERGFAG